MARIEKISPGGAAWGEHCGLGQDLQNPSKCFANRENSPCGLPREIIMGLVNWKPYQIAPRIGKTSHAGLPGESIVGRVKWRIPVEIRQIAQPANREKIPCGAAWRQHCGEASGGPPAKFSKLPIVSGKFALRGCLRKTLWTGPSGGLPRNPSNCFAMRARPTGPPIEQTTDNMAEWSVVCGLLLRQQKQRAAPPLEPLHHRFQRFREFTGSSRDFARPFSRG